MRIGLGYDVHAFGAGDKMLMGGVVIAHSARLVAPSDGDVLLHALSDPLLGAAGPGDIGRHFADTDPQDRDADSRAFVRQVYAEPKAQGWQRGNADMSIIAQAP